VVAGEVWVRVELVAGVGGGRCGCCSGGGGSGGGRTELVVVHVRRAWSVLVLLVGSWCFGYQIGQYYLSVDL